MIKNNKWKLVAASVLTLMPAIFGIIFWNKLPVTMNIHWGIDGNADGVGSRGIVVFLLPCILLALQWLCLLVTALDKNNERNGGKMQMLVIWIIPLISIYVNAIIYTAAFGIEFDIIKVTLLLIGLMFLLIGNYLPKCRQNRTVGIKIKWTLASEENWNATHRFSGKVWVICGIVMLIGVLLPMKASVVMMLAVIIVSVILPLVYSRNYYNKQKREDTLDDRAVIPMSKTAKIGSAFGLVVLAIVIGVVLFTGNIEIEYSAETFTVKASYIEDLTVAYDEIESIEYREDFDFGIRTFGYGSVKLSMGTFKNNEFGTYTLYAYNACKNCVIIEVDGKKLAVNGENEAATKEIYEELSER